MKKLLATTAIVMLLSSVAGAADIAPPWDRYEPGTTYTDWDTWFEFTGTPGEYLADTEYNLNGTPLVIDPYPEDSEGEILDEYDGRYDVLHTTNGYWLEMHIPNEPDPMPSKEIYLQIVWHWDGVPQTPDVYEPDTGASIELLEEYYLGGASSPDGWWYSRFHITITPSPDFEEIDLWPIQGWDDLYIDQLVIDTKCVPEPATLSLLAIGGLALARRRR